MKKVLVFLALLVMIVSNVALAEIYESEKFTIFFPDGYHLQPDDASFITYAKDDGISLFMFSELEEKGFEPYNAITDISYSKDFDAYMRSGKEPVEMGNLSYAKVIPILYSVYKLSDRYEIYTAFPGYDCYLIIVARYPLDCDYKTELEQFLCHKIFPNRS